jgi:hypothetical protein
MKYKKIKKIISFNLLLSTISLQAIGISDNSSIIDNIKPTRILSNDYYFHVSNYNFKNTENVIKDFDSSISDKKDFIETQLKIEIDNFLSHDYNLKYDYQNNNINDGFFQYKKEFIIEFDTTSKNNNNINNIRTFSEKNIKTILNNNDKNSNLKINFKNVPSKTGKVYGTLSNGLSTGRIYSIGSIFDEKNKKLIITVEKFNGLTFYTNKIYNDCLNKKALPKYLMIAPSLYYSFISFFQDSKNNSVIDDYSKSDIENIVKKFQMYSPVIKMKDFQPQECNKESIVNYLVGTQLFAKDGEIVMNHLDRKMNFLFMTSLMSDVMYDVNADDGWLKMDKESLGYGIHSSRRRIGKFLKRYRTQMINIETKLYKITSKRFINKNDKKEFQFSNDDIFKIKNFNIGGLYAQKSYQDDRLLKNGQSFNFFISSVDNNNELPNGFHTFYTPPSINNIGNNDASADLEGGHKDSGHWKHRNNTNFTTLIKNLGSTNGEYNYIDQLLDILVKKTDNFDNNKILISEYKKNNYYRNIIDKKQNSGNIDYNLILSSALMNDEENIMVNDSFESKIYNKLVESFTENLIGTTDTPPNPDGSRNYEVSDEDEISTTPSNIANIEDTPENILAKTRRFNIIYKEADNNTPFFVIQDENDLGNDNYLNNNSTDNFINVNINNIEQVSKSYNYLGYIMTHWFRDAHFERMKEYQKDLKNKVYQLLYGINYDTYDINGNDFEIKLNDNLKREDDDTYNNGATNYFSTKQDFKVLYKNELDRISGMFDY